MDGERRGETQVNDVFSPTELRISIMKFETKIWQPSQHEQDGANTHLWARAQRDRRGWLARDARELKGVTSGWAQA